MKMKTPNLFLKIDSKVIQLLLLLAIVGIFVYIFYYHYNIFSDYQADKTIKDKQAVERPPIKVPEFFNFNPDKVDNILQYMLFSFDKSKVKVPPSAVSPATTTGSGKYNILGVVKRNRLFLLVRFLSDNKIQLYSEGMSIDGNSRIERLSTDQVTIVDSSGQRQTHKIFQTEYRLDSSGEMRIAGSKPDSNSDKIPPPPSRKSHRKDHKGKKSEPPKPMERDKRRDKRLEKDERLENVEDEPPPPEEDAPLDDNQGEMPDKKEKKDNKNKKKGKSKMMGAE